MLRHSAMNDLEIRETLMHSKFEADATPHKKKTKDALS